MPSFSNYSDTSAVTHAHANVIIVLVEGITDQDFLERMFPGMKAELRFEPAHGCGSLPERLQAERRQCKKVFGLIDRDYLMRLMRWDDLFEIDDVEFARRTHQDGLYVLTSWEIENYLVHPDAVLELVRNWGPDELKNPQTLHDRLLAAALAELHVTAAWCTAHSCSFRQAGAPPACVDAAVLPEKIADWVKEKCPPEAIPVHDENILKVKAFDPGEAIDKRKRLLAVLRMVDGKRFLQRLQRKLININKDPAYQLATNAGHLGDDADDLHAVVTTLRQTR